MRLIQPLKFRTLEMWCFKMPHLQTAVFQTGITVASGLGSDSCNITEPRGNCNPHFENSRLETGRLQMGQFETSCFQCSELQRLD